MRCSCCSKDIFQNLTFSEIIGVSKYRLPQTCSVCRAQFHLLETRGCSGCQKPIHFNLESTEKKVKSIPVYCSDCQEWKKKYPTYDFQHRAFFVYDENMKAWLKQKTRERKDWRCLNLLNLQSPFLRYKIKKY